MNPTSKAKFILTNIWEQHYSKGIHSCRYEKILAILPLNHSSRQEPKDNNGMSKP